MRILLIAVSILFLSLNQCKQSFEPVHFDCDCNSEENKVNLIFRYGVGANNILNTFDCSFAKDMVLDPQIRTCMELQNEEIDTIFNKMNEIGFFDYPDTFRIPTNGEIVGWVTPYATYSFFVEHDGNKKILYWEDEISSPNQDADKLRELTRLIMNIIHSKSEYKRLPKARGVYI